MYLYVCMQYSIRNKDIFKNIRFLLRFEVYFHCFTMPTKKNLCLTRSQRKNKIIHLEQNAPIKRARLLVMKRLASEYLSSDFNGKFQYDIFYKQSSNVYPWLKKELLRWHIRRQRDLEKKKITLEKSSESSIEEGKATNTSKVCFIIP